MVMLLVKRYSSRVRILWISGVVKFGVNWLRLMLVVRKLSVVWIYVRKVCLLVSEKW